VFGFAFWGAWGLVPGQEETYSDTKYTVSMDGIQLTLNSSFKCKESKLKS